MMLRLRRLAKDEVIDWIAFYDHPRLHSTLGYARTRLNAEALEKVAREAITAIMAMHDVRQR